MEINVLKVNPSKAPKVYASGIRYIGGNQHFKSESDVKSYFNRLVSSGKIGKKSKLSIFE